MGGDTLGMPTVPPNVSRKERQSWTDLPISYLDEIEKLDPKCFGFSANGVGKPCRFISSLHLYLLGVFALSCPCWRFTSPALGSRSRPLALCPNTGREGKVVTLPAPVVYGHAFAGHQLHCPGFLLSAWPSTKADIWLYRNRSGCNSEINWDLDTGVACRPRNNRFTGGGRDW